LNKFIYKNAANAVSVLRILLSLSLLTAVFDSPQFYVLYLLTGLSDIFDGIIARKTGTQSVFGARLDSIGDIIFLICAGIKVLPFVLAAAGCFEYVLAAVSGIVRITAYAVSFFRQGKFCPLHIILNKLTGLLIFITVLLFASFPLLITVCCVSAVISSADELIKTSKSVGYTSDGKDK